MIVHEIYLPYAGTLTTKSDWMKTILAAIILKKLYGPSLATVSLTNIVNRKRTIKFTIVSCASMREFHQSTRKRSTYDFRVIGNGIILVTGV